MEYTLTTEFNGHPDIVDPCLNYVHRSLEVLEHPATKGVITDMDMMFLHIKHLIAEFCLANFRHYRKPDRFQVTYLSPVCCPSSITIKCGDQVIEIKEITVKQPLKSILQ